MSAINKVLHQMLVASLTISTISILGQIQALAQEQPPILENPQYSETTATGEMDQVTSVSQLSDVQPNDWAFQALQSLVERYGCIAGYPNGTFRGNRALSRYEFAAGLNACLDRVNELIATAASDA
ncbi:MAG: iron uptake porin, partial [Cuspidothrix sp.]